MFIPDGQLPSRQYNYFTDKGIIYLHDDNLCMIDHHIVLAKVHFYQFNKYIELTINDKVLNKTLDLILTSLCHISSSKHIIRYSSIFYFKE